MKCQKNEKKKLNRAKAQQRGERMRMTVTIKKRHLQIDTQIFGALAKTKTKIKQEQKVDATESKKKYIQKETESARPEKLCEQKVSIGFVSACGGCVCF